MSVPFFVPPEKRSPELMNSITEAMVRVANSGRYILGEEVENFELEFANYAGVDFVVGVSSGTDALVLMLQALGIGVGDDVIVPAFTFAATAEAVLRCGANILFADIDSQTLTIGANSIYDVITNKTRAIIPVSLFGAEPDWNSLSDFGVPLLFDGAQSFGIGSLSAEWKGEKPWLMASTSFFPSKTIGAMGDGGAIFTNDFELAKKIRSLRIHGKKESEFVLLGGNYRLDAIQAAILRTKLPYLQKHQTLRNNVALRYLEHLCGIDGLLLPKQKDYSYFVVRSNPNMRERIEHKFESSKIGFARYYLRPLYVEPLFGSFMPNKGLSVCEDVCKQTLALPFFPHILPDEIKLVVEAIKDSVSF